MIATLPNPARLFAVLPDWRMLACLPEHLLGRYDVALVNLACAVGLAGWEKIDAELCLRKLDEWAEKVREFTDRCLHDFHRRPAEYNYSEAYFRILAMITHLQRDLSVEYNPEKRDPDVPFELEDTFIHGIMQGDGGTCASMPVVYAAVGRRLGYPIKLVSVWADETAGHGFARWEDGTERFNIEATNTGLNTPPDEYYRTGRYKMTLEIQRLGGYLQSKTPRQELSHFLAERAIRWEEAGDHREAIGTWAWALSLHPEHVILEDTLKAKMNAMIRANRARKPAQFPANMLIKPPPVRIWPDTLPLHHEREILGMFAEENLLRNPDLTPVWEQMRRGQWNQPFPNTALVDCFADGTCNIGLHHS